MKKTRENMIGHERVRSEDKKGQNTIESNRTRQDRT